MQMAADANGSRCKWYDLGLSESEYAEGYVLGNSIKSMFQHFWVNSNASG